MIPKYVAQQYQGGARGFKSEKRKQLRALKKALDNLRAGAAFFPCGSAPVYVIAEQVDVIAQAISVKNWGR